MEATTKMQDARDALTLRSSRLTKLRAIVQEQGLYGFVIPRSDEHLSEYVPASAERLAWLTGFTGSAGLAVVLTTRAAVFTDGRYVLQLSQQVDRANWECKHITEDPPQAWIKANAPSGARIGYDPMLISEEGLARFSNPDFTMVAVDQNPIDALWSDRPPVPAKPVMLHPIEYSGCSAADKRAQVAKVLREELHDAAIISDPASIAWLLNIRGNDVPFTPFALGFGLIHADGSAELFMDPAKVSETARAWVGNSVSVSGREAMAPALAGLSGKRIRVDAGGTPVWFADTLRTAGASVVSGSDPCLLLKARKNSVEQAGARSAHERDAIALCEFLRFLDQRGASGSETELSAAAKLLALRERAPTFRGESFPAISAAAEHGAIIHYRVSEESNRALGKNEVYLIDSGAQYLDGTTDVTRTIWTGPDAPPQHLKEQATRVLQGHIRIASLVFPYGICGSHLDAIARSSLWQAGLDYDHGTGHGVGSYLSVHEGPVSLSRTGRPVPIESGMILSNEPGYYLSGAYGIRLENLLLVQPVEMSTSKPFLQFETLTLAPFDHRLIEPAMLERSERDWLNNYHQRVLEQVGPHLDADTQQWLADACKAID